MIDRKVLPHIGSVPLRRLTITHLEDLYAHLRCSGSHDGGPLAPETVVNLHQILRTALSDAERAGLVHATSPGGALEVNGGQGRVRRSIGRRRDGRDVRRDDIKVDGAFRPVEGGGTSSGRRRLLIASHPKEGLVVELAEAHAVGTSGGRESRGADRQPARRASRRRRDLRSNHLRPNHPRGGTVAAVAVARRGTGYRGRDTAPMKLSAAPPTWSSPRR